MYQSKEKDIFWFRMSVFFSWPLLKLAVCWKEKKKKRKFFLLGFHHSESDLGGLRSLGSSSRHVQAKMHHYVKLWGRYKIEKPVQDILTKSNRQEKNNPAF